MLLTAMSVLKALVYGVRLTVLMGFSVGANCTDICCKSVSRTSSGLLVISQRRHQYARICKYFCWSGQPSALV
jgi:hypothetical protein